MKLRIAKAFNNLPISAKILCGFLSVCCAMTAASGIVYYRDAKKAVEDSIRGQACDLRERIEREFAMYYAAPIEQELHILVTSPQLNGYLMSSKEEMLIHRADVERLFLSLSHGRDIYRSTTFLDASGQEKIGTCGNTRIRTFRSLAQRADEGLPGRNVNRVFTELKSQTAKPLSYSAPFFDAQNELGIVVAMAKQEPEAGGFGGAVVQHCDLMGFVQEVSQNRILGTAVVWVYGSNGEILASPPEGEIREDPKYHLAGTKASTEGCVYTAQCRFLADDEPVMTVVCSIPHEIISRQLAPVIRSVVVIFSALLAGSLASSLLISRWISGRIRTLTSAARNVSAQRLDLDLDAGLTESTDEIGILANAFQKMLLDLKTSTTSIDNLNLEIAQRKQTQEALRRERDRAQSYLDIADVMLVALNEKGHITLINREGSRILGYDEQELLGRDWFEMCLPSEARQNAQEVFNLLMGGEIDSVRYVENPVRTRSGEERIVAWHNTILRDHTGKAVGTLSSGEDITERRRFERRLARINECFLQQGNDSVENIHRLTALCGELLGGASALYNRMEEGLLCSLGQWNVPADFYPKDRPEGHICHDVIRRESENVQVIRNLASSPYAQTDPDVGRYGLQTYVGKAVRCGGQSVGSLCVVYQQDFCPTEEDQRILSIVASALAVEEERRQAQTMLHESEEQLRAITDSALDAIIVMDSHGKAVFWNPAAERIFGYQADEIIGTSIHQALAPSALRGAFETSFPAFLQTGKGNAIGHVLELAALRKDGTEFPIEIALSPIRKGRRWQAAAIIRDITDRKRAERGRTELLEQLAEINQELKDFAYVVSHDLKAPLRAIKALAEWLSTDYEDKLDEQGKENLRLLNSRVDRMHNLIDGVLQYSRIGRTEQGTVPVDLNRLVPEIIDGVGAPEHIAIHVEPGLPTVEADVTRITQVFQNLLSNAIKYMNKPQGNITVGCAQDDGFWTFSVADNGPGIEKKDFERIFKLFQTLVSREDYESTGVGLTVAKKIVEMYGGRIWVESEVGAGSTFFFTFPKQKEAAVLECLEVGAAP